MSYLPPALPLVNPVSPFPIDALPLIMQNAISYLQDGGKVPTVMAVNAVLAAVSLACHSHIDVTAFAFFRLHEKGW